MIYSSNVTGKKRELLMALTESPLAMGKLDGNTKRMIASFVANGLATVSNETARITEAGEAFADRLNGHAAEKPTRAKAKPKNKPAKPEARAVPVDFAALRAQIVARYEADLAACDRLAEIAQAVRG